MMNRISTYVFRQLLTGLVLVTVAVTCVVWLSQSLRFVEMIVNRGLSATMFVTLTGLMLPNFLTVILPIALFIVVTFSYHKMIMDRELVVMRAAGLSQLALSRPTVLLAMLIVFIGYALSLYMVPASYEKFRDMQWDIRYNFSQVLLREGTFNEVSKGITVYVRKRLSDGQLLGILAHDNRDRKKVYTLMAERGAMVETENGARVVMFNGNRQDLDPKTNQLSMLYFDRYAFDLERGKESSEGRFREPRERAMNELIDFKDKKVRNPGKFYMELHRRLAMPWSALGFTMIALASLISGNFTRRNEINRVVLAIALAGAYQTALLATMNIAAKELSLIPMIYVVTFAPIIIGTIVLMAPGTTRAGPRTNTGGTGLAQDGA